MDDEDDKLTPFDYFNSDINLLTLHILLEGFYRGQNLFTLNQFIKGDYWKIEEITEEIKDTQDYGSAEDLVLHQIIQIIRDLNLGKIKQIYVTDLYDLTESVVREALGKKESTEDDVMYYAGVLREIQGLETIRNKQVEEAVNSGKEFKYSRENMNKVHFTEDNFYRHIQFISAISAPFVEIEIDFNEKDCFALNTEIDELVQSFSQDDFLEKKPVYKAKRFYFTKQLENFYEYIKVLPEMDGYVNIPFSALTEQGFEVVKMLSFLERKERIKVRNWNDTELWNVKFHQVPITVASLFGRTKTIEQSDFQELNETKLNLSFSHQTGLMSLTDKRGSEYKINIQGQVQKEVLRVIFKNAENTYTEWSLYDISELLGGADVNERAVRNAIYQFNRKVKLSIPSVENLFVLTKHSTQLNPKYVENN